MGDSFFKKENAKKKAKKKQEKSLRREERKTNNNKGQSLEEMFAYVDENGRLTSTPPDKRIKNEISPENILLGARPIPEEPTITTGVITFLSDKGYGFVTDDLTNNKVFFHNNDVAETVKMKDKVSYEKKKTPRGDSAINLKKTH